MSDKEHENKIMILLIFLHNDGNSKRSGNLHVERNMTLLLVFKNDSYNARC